MPASTPTPQHPQQDGAKPSLPHASQQQGDAEQNYSQQAYEAQLAQKLAQVREDFSTQASGLSLPEIAVFRSPVKHFRMRTEFRIWHQQGKASYAMFSKEDKRPYSIEQLPIASERINQLMPALMALINQQELLRHKLFQAEFLTSLSGQAVISLIYHKPLGDDWQLAARQVREQLGVDIIGRSRKQKVCIERDFVIEQLHVNGRQYQYQQVESSFTQPNARICEQMLSWAQDHTRNLGGDLLELYCGNGNFTLPLAQNFNKVLATEISKTSVESALFNSQLNQVNNLQIARMSSEEFTQAMDGVREFNRLRHICLPDYTFSTIFVDPPRAGMDADTCRLAQRFDNIVYISCNPQTLRDNLQQLCETHDISAFAIFDQFPYTHHVECGVVLTARCGINSAVRH